MAGPLDEELLPPRDESAFRSSRSLNSGGRRLAVAAGRRFLDNGGFADNRHWKKRMVMRSVSRKGPIRCYLFNGGLPRPTPPAVYRLLLAN